MPILETIGSKCGEFVFDEASRGLKRGIEYLLDYKNLTNLEDEKTELGKKRAKISEKVEEAKTRGEDIKDEVSKWLENVDKKKKDLDEFMVDKPHKENMQCFNNRFSFPNLMGRYKLSKQAEEMKVNFKKLTDEASTFDTVSRPKPPPIETAFPSIEGYQEFESRDSVFRHIVEALTDSEVKIVGIYGQGGVGKTTIVQKVGKHVKNKEFFDEVVVAVVSQPQNVTKIQEQIACRLNPKLDLGSDPQERAGQLMHRLNNGKKNLIILDDIWEKLENLNVIGIPITDVCKLVLTSRDPNNWKNMEVHCEEFQIHLLSDSEAWDLFEKKVGNSVGDELIYPVAQKVCQECRRLPVAITAVGAALKDRDLSAWNNALKQLENSMIKYIDGIDPKLYNSLKLSYDLLQSEDAKSIFRLCCLFPEDANISIDKAFVGVVGLKSMW